MIVVKNNTQLLEEERLEAERLAAMEQASFEQSLAGYIRKRWQAAYDAKRLVHERMLKSLRQRKGEYEPDKLALIRQVGGTPIFMMLTDEKCTAAESWLEDIFFIPNERPFDVRPSRNPDLSPADVARIEEAVATRLLQTLQSGMAVTPDQVAAMAEHLKGRVEKELREKAKVVAGRMADKIEDQFLEGGWYEALREAIPDVVTYPAGFISGPVMRKRPRLTWVSGPDGEYRPEVADILRPEWDRVSPFDIFPGPSSRGVDDDDLFERVYLSRSALFAMIGAPGFNETAIREVLASGEGAIRDWLYASDTERQQLEDRPHEAIDAHGRIVSLNFWGEIPGRLLMDWGMPGAGALDPDRPYPCEAWQIGPWTIKVRVNDDPLGRKPYFKASFRDLPGSFWGMGVPELMTDCQDMCNAAARNLAANLAIASGPQVAVDVDQIDSKERPDQIYPWKVWLFHGNKGGSGREPVKFFKVDALVDQLLKVYEKFSSEADTKTGIPKYSYGTGEMKGALATASGLSMMLQSATKGIKRVAAHIDVGVVEPSVRLIYQDNMLFDPDPSIKGDCEVTARGSSALIFKDTQALRRGEFMQATSNDVDMQIMGLDGRAALLREHAKGLDLPADKVVPSDEDLAMRQQAAMQQQQQQQQAMAQGAPQGGQPGQGPRNMLPDGSPAGGDNANLMRSHV